MRQKRLTRKEKIALSNNTSASLESIPKHSSISPEELYITDKEVVKKIVVFKEEDALSDDFKPPTKYYFVYCTGHHIYIKTRNRLEAQRICDIISGKVEFYKVRQVMLAQVR